MPTDPIQQSSNLNPHWADQAPCVEQVKSYYFNYLGIYDIITGSIAT